MGETNETKATAVDLAGIRARRARLPHGYWSLDRAPTDGPGYRFEVRVNEGGRTTVVAKLMRDEAVFFAHAPGDVDALLGLVEAQTRALLALETVRALAFFGCPMCSRDTRYSEDLERSVAEHKPGCQLDAALAAAGLPDQLSRDLKRAEIAAG